jgi:ATP synthase protein I
MPLDSNENRSPDLPPAAKDVKNFSRQFAQAMELPFVLVAAILIGGAMGYFLDRWLHTKPVFMMIFGGIGFVAGVRDVLRRLPKE